MGRSSAAALALFASLLVHASVMLMLRQLHAPPPLARSEPVPFEVTERAIASPNDDAEVQQQRSAQALPIVAGGPQSLSNIDRDVNEGRPGDCASPDISMLLFPFASNVTLQDTDLNNLERNQSQRIQTARNRATQEERRATPNAAESSFLASGTGGHHERRQPAKVDSAAGAKSSQPATLLGAAHAFSDGSGERVAPPDDQPAPMGATKTSPGAGLLSGKGKVAKNAARVAFARPNVDPGPAATAAERQDEQVRDDVDAELLAARMQRSIVDATMARGERVAAGLGGHAGRGDGLGHTRGDGASALPYAPGLGRDGALDTRDGRYIRWFVEQRARVQAGLVFPYARALAKDQGTSVYRVFVTKEGTLAGPMFLVRSSGFADFDAAASAAIRHAAPFAPLPDELMQHADKLAILIPIAFENPMVE